MSRPLVIAHRGARSLAPENTLAGARKAFEVGADMWELDVQATADGALIVFHDETLTRTTDVRSVFPARAPWQVADFLLAEIKQLNTGPVFLRDDPFGQIAAGRISPAEQVALHLEPVPTLREALQLTGRLNWHVNIEIKSMPRHRSNVPVVNKVLALIEGLGLEKQVLVSSFKRDYLEQIAARNPRISLALLTEGPLVERWLARVLLPGVPPPSLVYMPGSNPGPLLDSLNSSLLHPYYRALNPDDVPILKRRGIDVNVWTINAPAEMQRWIAAGVNGLITDFPQVLVELLKNTPNQH